MDYSVFLHPKVNGLLKKLAKEHNERIMESIRGLRRSPDCGERLANSKFYKLRVGDYRIIYEIWHPEKKVVVLYVGPRKKVYTDFEKYL